MAKPISFNANAALQTARGFHYAAGRLERIHLQDGLALPNTGQDPTTYLTEMIGGAAGAVVLEALAIELVLKVRLKLAGLGHQRGHNHSILFSALPQSEQRRAESVYQSIRHPAMRSTLAEVLEFSAGTFEKWRYMHEEVGGVQASGGEMQKAFRALVAGL